MISDEEFLDWLVRQSSRRPLDVKEQRWLDEYLFKNPVRDRPEKKSAVPKPAYVFLVAVVPLTLLLWWVSV